ncbi:MAG: hypothetical protein ACJ8F7_04680 [Gemmataceae bacterium]
MFAVRVLLGVVAAALLGGVATADEKKDEKKGGTVAGLVTAKDKNWIELKADGEEKARRYVPKWVGGTPAQGGGPDKKILEAIAAVKVGSRVRLEWEFEERARVVKLDVLKAAEKDETKEKK